MIGDKAKGGITSEMPLQQRQTRATISLKSELLPTTFKEVLSNRFFIQSKLNWYVKFSPKNAKQEYNQPFVFVCDLVREQKVRCCSFNEMITKLNKSKQAGNKEVAEFIQKYTDISQDTFCLARSSYPFGIPIQFDIQKYVKVLSEQFKAKYNVKKVPTIYNFFTTEDIILSDINTYIQYSKAKNNPIREGFYKYAEEVVSVLSSLHKGADK